MNRLRSYRAIEGMTQHELAAKLGVSAALISAIESGRRSPTVDLERIGYGADRFEVPDMSEPLHRHRASTATIAKARARELLRLAGEVFADLSARTERVPTVAIERIPAPADFDTIEELAGEVRLMLQVELEGPVRNLTALVERAGVCIVPIVGLVGIDGISAWVDGVPVIGLDPDVPGDRFRFSLAHELAHLILHRRRTELVEQEANRLAGALLFPREEFDTAMPQRPQLRDFTSLKASWGVSVAALVYRAHDLGHIDDDRYRALQIQMSRWRKTEPGEFEPALGQLLQRMIESHGGPDGVAGDRGFNRRHVRELVHWRPRRLRLA